MNRIFLYLELVAAILIGVGLYGFAAPALLSAHDTALFVPGVVICVLGPTVAFLIYRRLVEQFT